jgi:hypothetical protein
LTLRARSARCIIVDARSARCTIDARVLGAR